MNLSDLTFSHEPALYIAALNAVLVLGVAFGLPITGEQRTAILTTVSAVLAIVAGVAIRQRVTPVRA